MLEAATRTAEAEFGARFADKRGAGSAEERPQRLLYPRALGDGLLALARPGRVRGQQGLESRTGEAASGSRLGRDVETSPCSIIIYSLLNNYGGRVF